VVQVIAEGGRDPDDNLGLAAPVQDSEDLAGGRGEHRERLSWVGLASL
jgi:hypothetical protein